MNESETEKPKEPRGFWAHLIKRLADASDREYHGVPPIGCGNPDIKKIGDRSAKRSR